MVVYRGVTGVLMILSLAAGAHAKATLPDETGPARFERLGNYYIIHPEILATRLPELRKQAENGQAEARYWTAFAIGNGYGTRRDHAEALRLYHLAEAQHFAPADYKIGFYYAMAWSVPGDNDEALRWYLKGAHAGDIQSETALGDVYGAGLGVPAQPSESRRWYEAAAKAGGGEAAFDLAWFYCGCRNSDMPADRATFLRWLETSADNHYGPAMSELGASLAKENPAQSLVWVQKAADAEDARGEWQLGVRYAEGDGVKRDGSQAVAWLSASAALGNNGAMNKLASLYEEGRVVPKDYGKSFPLRVQLAQTGFAWSEYNLGNAYFYHKGTPRDPQKAMEWWQRAAIQGEPMAQNNLGATTFDGIDTPRNYLVAYIWLNASAANGFDHAREKRDRAQAMLTPAELQRGRELSEHYIFTRNGNPLSEINNRDDKNALAQYRFGNLYHDGAGVKHDDTQAVAWWRKAADQNLAMAQLALGHAYADGKGVPKNTATAALWYGKAAGQGDGDAEKFLGQLYEKGDGVPRDPVQAYALYSRATHEYSDDAVFDLNRLSKSMTAAQIQEGQQMAGETPAPHRFDWIQMLRVAGIGAFVGGLVGLLRRRRRR